MNSRFEWVNYLDPDTNVLDLSKRRTDPYVIVNEDVIDLVKFLNERPEIDALYLSDQNLNVSSIAKIAAVTSLRLLNFDNIKNGDAVAEIFGENTHINSLSLSNSNLGPEAGRLLAANNHLKILDLSLNHLGRGVAAFADNTCLVDLDLSFNKVPARAAIPLAKNSQLKKLNLSHNKLGALDAIALAGNTGIEELILSSNKVGEIGAAAFINNSTLISLSLNYNNVQDKAAVVLAGHPTLLKLELATNGLTPACAAAFEKNSILEYLNLSHNKIGDAVGLALAKNHQYRVLGLHGTGITDATVLALADNNHLIMLDAGGNPMLTAISAKVVSQFDALVSLDLSGTKITDDGVGYFADHPSMRQLSLVDSHLSDRAAYALTQNTVLSEVHLDFNDISVSGGIALHGNLKIDATTDGSSYNTDEHEPLHSVEDQAKLDEVDPLKRVSNARALGALAPLPSLVDLSMFAVSKAVSEDKIQLDSSVSHIVRQHSHVKMKK